MPPDTEGLVSDSTETLFAQLDAKPAVLVQVVCGVLTINDFVPLAGSRPTLFAASFAVA